MTWNEFPNIFVEWVKWTYPQFSQSPYELKLSEQGSVIVTSNDEASYSKLGMSIQQEDSTSILPLVPLGNGRYEADVSKLTSGIYLSQIGETKPTNSGEQAELENAVTTGFVVPYSAEYRLDANKAEAREKLEALAQLTGGQVRTLEEAESLFQFDPVTLKQSYDWSRELLLLLIILWLADIANRRLALPWGRWLAKLRTATSMSNGHKQQRTSVEQSTFQRLNERKQQLAERGNTLLTKEEQWGEAAQQPVDRQNDQKLQVSQGLENHQKEEPHSTEKNETMNRLLAAKNRRKQ